MGFFDKEKAKSRDEPVSNIPTGRVSSASINSGSFYGRTRNMDILNQLRSIQNEPDAIEFITKKTPDGSMAVWNFVRMANQGHQMRFYSLKDTEKGTPLKDIEAEWRDFASRINAISNAGLDGLIDIFHKYSVMYGNQMCEVEVSPQRDDIVEVHPIDPRTIYWEWEVRNGRKVPVPYQHNDQGMKVDLSKGNIFYVPLDPAGDDPKGTLIMSPALSAIDSQLQVFVDVHAVLHHQGYSRDMYTIDRAAALNSCPPAIKNNPKELKKWLEDYLDMISTALKSINPDADIVTFDDVNRVESKGGVARSVDFRAINEMTDYQTNNGLKQLSTFMNRHSGRTETYASVELKIFTQGILSLQRGSKRLVEEIARLWLRVRGIQAIPVFTHNPIDYVSELQRRDIKLKDVEIHAKAQALGWISGDRGAQDVMGEDKAYTDVPPGNIKVSYDSGGDEGEDDKHSGENRDGDYPEGEDSI